MLRERKIVLFVMGDEEILERSRMVVSQLALEYSVKIVRNYSAAYKIIVEHQVDVMVCGPAEEQFCRCIPVYGVRAQVEALSGYAYDIDI